MFVRSKKVFLGFGNRNSHIRHVLLVFDGLNSSKSGVVPEAGKDDTIQRHISETKNLSTRILVLPIEYDVGTAVRIFKT